MFSLIQRLLLLLGVLLCLLVTIVLLAIDDEPTLNTRALLTPEQIDKAKRVFDRNDPRRVRAGHITTANLGQEELNLALNYAANQYLQGAASLKLESGLARIETSLPLPGQTAKRYLNLQFKLKQTQALPEITAMTLGALAIPDWVAQSLIDLILQALPMQIDTQALTGMLKQVKFTPQRLYVTYQWRPDLAAKIGDVLASDLERELIGVYQQRLAELTQAHHKAFTLTEVLQPLFQLAQQRSRNGDAIQENRAVIRVLAFYVNKKDLSKLLPSLRRQQQPQWRSVLLQNRDDFTKHYLVSAFLAADAGSPLADAMGLYKEIQDAKDGSGFSFNDIAADRAGTRMGELAIGGEKTAKAIQAFLKSANEADIMPKTDDLPEFMSESEFNRRYGGLQGDAYQRMMQEIESRIAALAINRQQP